MSRKLWHVSRALRVLIACLALWLPARSAAAWMAPADAVVVVACAAGTASELRTARIDEQRETRRTAAVHRAPTNAALFPWLEPTFVATKTASRAVTPPLFLLHCALLC